MDIKRFTKAIAEEFLKANEGFETDRYFSNRNSRNNNHYSIEDGKLFVRSTGKTSWADSRYDHKRECSPEETRRFLKEEHGRRWTKLKNPFG